MTTAHNTHAITGDTYRFRDVIKSTASSPVYDKARKAWLVDAEAAEKLTRPTYHICARYLTATPIAPATPAPATNNGYCRRCQSYCYGDCQS